MSGSTGSYSAKDNLVVRNRTELKGPTIINGTAALSPFNESTGLLRNGTAIYGSTTALSAFTTAGPTTLSEAQTWGGFFLCSSTSATVALASPTGPNLATYWRNRFTNLNVGDSFSLLIKNLGTTNTVTFDATVGTSVYGIDITIAAYGERTITWICSDNTSGSEVWHCY